MPAVHCPSSLLLPKRTKQLMLLSMRGALHLLGMLLQDRIFQNSVISAWPNSNPDMVALFLPTSPATLAAGGAALRPPPLLRAVEPAEPAVHDLAMGALPRPQPALTPAAALQLAATSALSARAAGPAAASGSAGLRWKLHCSDVSIALVADTAARPGKPARSIRASLVGDDRVSFTLFKCQSLLEARFPSQLAQRAAGVGSGQYRASIAVNDAGDLTAPAAATRGILDIILHALSTCIPCPGVTAECMRVEPGHLNEAGHEWESKGGVIGRTAVQLDLPVRVGATDPAVAVLTVCHVLCCGYIFAAPVTQSLWATTCDNCSHLKPILVKRIARTKERVTLVTAVGEITVSAKAANTTTRADLLSSEVRIITIASMCFDQ